MANEPSPDPHTTLTRELRRVDADAAGELLRAADVETAVAAVRALESSHQALLLQEVPATTRADILSRLPPDEVARLLSSTDRADDWLEELPPSTASVASALLRYPAESIGRMMTPRVMHLDASDTVASALERIRRREDDIETIYRLPVSDDGRFVGMVELRDLLSAPDDARVGTFAEDGDFALDPHDDQEVGARQLLASEALALPVTDQDGCLVGVVTFDDAMEVLQLEEEEDAARTSGADPLRQPYLAASLWKLARSRAVWLVAAASAGVITVRVLEFFEAELEQVVALALFIPLLLGTGGNIGAQAATTVVRAMAVDDLTLRDLPRVVWREAGVGMLLGGLIAVLAATPIALVYQPRLALVVCLTLVSVCMIGTTAGSLLPLGVGRMGADPAVISAPFITTLVDATGLLVYFTYAQLIFGL